MYFMIHVMVDVGTTPHNILDIRDIIQEALPEGLRAKIEVDQNSFTIDDVFNFAVKQTTEKMVTNG